MALTADRQLNMRDVGGIRRYAKLTGTVIYKNGLVACPADGYAVPGADTAASVFLGIATEYAGTGQLWVDCYTQGVFELPCVTTYGAVKNVGAWFVLGDDLAGVAGTTTNDVPLGIGIEVGSTTSLMWIDIQPLGLLAAFMTATGKIALA